MAAEFFDDKLLSIGYSVFGVLETRNLTLDDFVFLEALTNIGMLIEDEHHYLNNYKMTKFIAILTNT